MALQTVEICVEFVVPGQRVVVRGEGK